MPNALVALAVVVCAVVAGIVGARRRRSAPTQPRLEVPAQIDRADFERPDAEWLVAVFSSASCHTCADVVAKARALETRTVAVHDVEYTAHRDLHSRYDIDAVPAVLIADHDGVVRAHFMGPVTATDLWAAVAECRDPGSRPDASCHGDSSDAD